MEKIAVFGGTFDPVHYGHIFLAKQALIECGLDHVLVIPAKIQPFKIGQTAAGEGHRLNMAKLAFENEEKISVSDLEIKNGGVSYTVNTLRAVKRLYPGASVAFIIGTDAFLKVRMWRDAEEILSEYSFIVGTRPGYKNSEVAACIAGITAVYNTEIRTVNNKQLQISSTEIKRRVCVGESCGEMIPDSVERYIVANGLYTKIH